jgi:translocation and assembly module TamB
LLIAAGSLVVLLLLLVLAGLITLRTEWFHDFVRTKMIEAIEKATGGKSEVGSYTFDWKTMTARVDNFVLHGTEPADTPPLLRAQSVTAALKIISVLEKKIDLLAVDVKQPQIHIIVHEDGSTNIPAPKVRREPRKDPTETILDLAVKKFTIENGTLLLAEETTPFDLRGENLRVALNYQAAGPRYAGSVHMNPLYFRLGSRQPFPISADVNIAIKRGRIHFDSERLALARSTFKVSGDVTNLAHAEVRFRYQASVDLDEIRRALELAVKPRGRVQVSGEAFYAGASKFTFDGDLHAGGVAIDLSDFHIRDTEAEAAMHLRPEKLTLARLQLSTIVNPPSAPKGRTVRVQGRIGDAQFGLKSEDLDLRDVRLATLGGTFEGTAQFRKFERFQTEGNVTGFDARTLLAIYSPQAVPWDGLISGPITVAGSLMKGGSIDASAKATISPAAGSAPVHGSVEAKYDSRTETLDLGHSTLSLPATSVQFAGVLGRELRVRVDSKNLDEILPAAGIATTGPKGVPIQLHNGEVVFTGTVSGKLAEPHVAGHATATNFVYDRHDFDAFAADVTASPAGVELKNASLTHGKLRAQFQGSVGLADWKTSDASTVAGTASVANANLADLLAMANQKDVPVSGTLTASGQVSGTIGSPAVAADLHLAKGQIQGEPFDRLDAKVSSSSDVVTVSDGRITAGARQIDASATYHHAAGDFERGRVQFKVATNSMPLDQFQTVVNERPGAKGSVQMSADGAAVVSQKAGKPDVQIAEFRADITARGLALDEQMLGDAHVTATTQGQTLITHMDSNFAHSTIKGDGRWQLTGDYPGSTDIQFTNLDFTRLSDWLAPPKQPPSVHLAGSAEGHIMIEGPMIKPELWKASLNVPQFELRPVTDAFRTRNRAPLALKNAEPIAVTMQNDVIRVGRAHFTGNQTNITVGGTIALKQRNPLDLTISGKADLALLQTFDPEILSSGQVEADANIRGTFADPLVSGKLQLNRANLNYGELPNGLSNANGVIVFSGTRARIQNLTAESGGGKIVISGFSGFGSSGVAFRVQLDATGIRVRYPEGVSTVADASLTLSGTNEGSLLAGTITIQRTGFNPRTDLASVLAKSSEPERAPSAQAGFLADMQLDVQIQMAPDVTFQSSLAENIQAEANLRLRGTALSPALLGRIVITQGQIIFFGTKFTIDQGNISFYNPVKIEPVLDIDLETKARGVEVILTVSGPISKLNLTPRSDPPLQFAEIVALLATGTTPTSDPTLAVQQSATPTQSFQQIGASALLGQALANPVAGRLQRFFGVTKLRIDPTLQGVENNPQARLTIEQQVTPEITFTYITNITNSNPQVVRVEWALNRTWSVVALREENGLFGLDFLYKKRFK